MDGADSWGDVQVNTCGFAQLLSAPALFHENEGRRARRVSLFASLHLVQFYSGLSKAPTPISKEMSSAILSNPTPWP